MANVVNIVSMPRAYLRIPPRLRPTIPPIFDGEPTAEDRELARELFAALDPTSQDWYRGASPRLFEGL